MGSERRVDLGIASGAIAVAAAIAVATRGFPGSSQAGDPGPALFPLLVAAALATLGLVRLIGRGSGEQEPAGPGGLLPVVAMLATGAAAVWLMSWVGFILGACALLAAGALIAGERRPLRIVLYATLTSVAVYTLFVMAFAIRLPRGPLEELLG